VHPTGGSLRVFKQVSWLGVGSGKVALSRPTHPRVTQAVRRQVKRGGEVKVLRLSIAFVIVFMSISCSAFKSKAIAEPTLTTDESQKIVRDLLENNAGCRLPCWWGITPGETTWVGARQILEKVSSFMSEPRSEETFYVDLHVLLPYPQDSADYMEHSYHVENGVVDYIDVYNFNLAPNYALPNLLKSYGQPDEIWIRTFPKAERGIQHFLIDVFYGKLGILAEYGTGDPMKEVNGNLQNCLITDMDSPFLDLWSPKTQNLSFQEAKTFIDTVNLPEPKPLFEATGMDVKTFYETFKNSKTNVCLETPKKLWQ